MSIAKSGLRSMLQKNIKLLSGPGCPVCVTPPEVIDAVLELAMEKDVIITTYGDMLRVPGSTTGDSLQRRRAMGARVQMVYSPVDAVQLAKENPDKQVVFLGVGFETTAPGTAAAALTAAEQRVENFSLWSMLKTVEPALRALMAMPDFNIDGFICPGHVATIIGVKGFRFLPEEYSMPAVIAGFEPGGHSPRGVQARKADRRAEPEDRERVPQGGHRKRQPPCAEHDEHLPAPPCR